ncbi:MAG TPA: hypothetical protein VKV21_10730 [Solirubrobacteraceae bacterium]|nr:hypothetical protein [Solirubrobacteraceae bacterium]
MTSIDSVILEVPHVARARAFDDRASGLGRAPGLRAGEDREPVRVWS